ncbi:LPS-assembly protein LptD [Halopseudomonas laoshanensis]|uniref:LPS-assembly protein LptD n=1 Tax=Halopseudomonas laoshanensis TaxID=2268758 RepID=A0A7V7GUL0_9GAMM|nr:LPS-assembly protein LptD [Halopseudomonas laoshanensis]KAA0695227.1 LPS-assembly protein LptD [Halopseudomonas laoshanensis]
MAYRTPPFRPTFPMLLVSGLLLAQPLSSVAANQVECRASSSGAGWDCSPMSAPAALPPRPAQAVQPAPRATEPAPVEAPESVTAATPASRPAVTGDYSELDWVPREQLSSEQQAAIAPYCGGMYVEPEREGRDNETPFNELPVSAAADSSSFEQGSQTGTLEGDVLLQQGRLQAQSNQASFDQANNLIVLDGNVRLRDQGVLVLGDSARMQIDTGETRIDQVRYVVHESRARGTATKLMRRDDAVIVMTDGTYTTCEPGENTWALHSKDIELNREEGWGEAKHVTLRVKDVPVFYTPWMNFPLDDRRKSGLLTPSFASSTDSGSELTVPYYFNLAPNYDATLYPRFMSKRGLLMEGEARHMNEQSQSQINAAYLDDSEFGDTRWMYQLRHDNLLAPRWRANVDYSDISDPFYFQHLNSSLESRPDTYVNQRVSSTYAGNTWRFEAAVHSYELADITSVTPYDRLPQLRLDGANRIAGTGLRFNYRTEYSYFDRDLNSGLLSGRDGVQFDDANIGIREPDESLVGLQRATGSRVVAAPALEYPMTTSWGFLTPTVKAVMTQYDLDFDDRNDGFDYAGAETTPGNVTPLASLDGGLYFDRQANWFGQTFRQTFEPRAYYLYAPYRDQSDQPLFDTNEFAFSYSSLFRDNRFSGSDRISDANQFTLGATSRFLDDAGRERIRGSLGQIFYLSDRDVALLPDGAGATTDPTQSTSAYAGEFMYQMSDAWRFRSDVIWNPDNNNEDAGSAIFNYQPEPRKIINAGYRFRNNINTFDALSGTFRRNANDRIDQSDLSTIWPINNQWSVIARWQHDFTRDRTLEAFGGLEYDSCCYKVRVINRYWVDYDEYETVTDDSSNRGIFIQIVLKGLGNVTGNRVESLFDQGIPGYRERENNGF